MYALTVISSVPFGTANLRLSVIRRDRQCKKRTCSGENALHERAVASPSVPRKRHSVVPSTLPPEEPHPSHFTGWKGAPGYIRPPGDSRGNPLRGIRLAAARRLHFETSPDVSVNILVLLAAFLPHYPLPVSQRRSQPKTLQIGYLAPQAFPVGHLS